MKVIKVNEIATITKGSCKGLKGIVEGYDSTNDGLIIGIDVYTKIIVDSESVEQNQS